MTNDTQPDVERALLRRVLTVHRFWHNDGNTSCECGEPYITDRGWDRDYPQWVDHILRQLDAERAKETQP